MPISRPFQYVLHQRLAVSRSLMPRLAAWWLLVALGVLFLGARAHAGNLPHHAAQSLPSMTAVVDHDDADHHDHGSGDHRHTGDDLVDLLTLGHCHSGAACAGVLPSALVLDIPVLRERPVALWRDRGIVQRIPSTPFRPPIA